MNNSRRNSLEKSSIQPIVAGVVGAVLLVSCVALYIVKMPVVALVVGIVGLACIGLALYNIQHQARESGRFGTTYRSALFESSIIGIFVVFYAVKSINSFAAVFMGFIAAVVKDDLKYTQSLKCDSKVTSGGCFFL